MSRSNTRSFITRLFLFVSVLAFVGAELLVPAQNSNSSTTMQNDNMSASNMTGTPRRSSRRRRGRRRGRSMSNANMACGPMQDVDVSGGAAGNTSTTVQLRPGQSIITDRPVGAGRCDPNVQEQTDLSGTYNGTVNYSEGGLSGDATLTISGNDFTLKSGSSTQEGRVVAVTTCNYTAVTMMFGKWQPAGPGAPQPALLPTVSLQAKKTAGGVTLMTAPGERREFSFSATAAAGGNSSGGRRPRRGRRKTKSKAAENACNPMAHAVTLR